MNKGGVINKPRRMAKVHEFAGKMGVGMKAKGYRKGGMCE